RLRIGCGAGFVGGRLEPALILNGHRSLAYLVLECLVESTIAFAQKRQEIDLAPGNGALLQWTITRVPPLLVQKKTRLITNMGAANPLAVAEKILEIGKRLGVQVKVAVVVGDDVFDRSSGEELTLEGNLPLNTYGKLISASAYLGAD